MDHHCHYLFNCVGHRNHQAYLLFMVYHTLHSSTLLWEAHRHYRKNTIPNALLFWLAINAVLTVFTLLLSLMHIVLVSINKTTLQYYYSESSHNCYDLGIIGNCLPFFNHSLLFFIPGRTTTFHDGSAFPCVPGLSRQQEKEEKQKSASLSLEKEVSALQLNPQLVIDAKIYSFRP